MILQHYEFAVDCQRWTGLRRQRRVRLFPSPALEQQVGIRDAAPYQIERRRARRRRIVRVPADAPFPDSRWRMIDRVDALVLDGGPHGLGVVRGSTQVDPDAWFFKAHFLDDPVWPGSLGLESLLQLLKIVAASRWGADPSTVFESPALGPGPPLDLSRPDRPDEPARDGSSGDQGLR